MRKRRRESSCLESNQIKSLDSAIQLTPPKRSNKRTATFLLLRLKSLTIIYGGLCRCLSFLIQFIAIAICSWFRLVRISLPTKSEYGWWWRRKLSQHFLCWPSPLSPLSLESSCLSCRCKLICTNLFHLLTFFSADHNHYHHTNHCHCLHSTSPSYCSYCGDKTTTSRACPQVPSPPSAPSPAPYRGLSLCRSLLMLPQHHFGALLVNLVTLSLLFSPYVLHPPSNGPSSIRNSHHSSHHRYQFAKSHHHHHHHHHHLHSQSHHLFPSDPSNDSDQQLLPKSFLLSLSLISPFTLVAAADSPFQGLHLNSFIPHFEPLYYDRQHLMGQFARIKRHAQTATATTKTSKSKKHKKKTKKKKKTNKAKMKIAASVLSNQRTKRTIVDRNKSDISLESSSTTTNTTNTTNTTTTTAVFPTANTATILSDIVHNVINNDDNDNNHSVIVDSVPEVFKSNELDSKDSSSRSTTSTAEPNTFALADRQRIKMESTISTIVTTSVPVSLRNQPSNSIDSLLLKLDPTSSANMAGAATTATNLSTTTAAFIRHNCPLPHLDNLDHMKYHHDSELSIVDSSTENISKQNRVLAHGDEEQQHSSKLNNDNDSNLERYQVDSESINNTYDEGLGESEEEEEEEEEEVVVDDEEEEEEANRNSDRHHDDDRYIRLEFVAHNRKFRLKLHSNSDKVFAPDVVFESTGRKDFHYDTANVVQGHLEDDEDATFNGIITRDGLLDGHLLTRHDEFYIEPASRHSFNDHDFHSVIYSTSVVNFPNMTYGSASPGHGTRYISLTNPFQPKPQAEDELFFNMGIFDNFKEALHLRRSRRDNSVVINAAEDSAEDSSNSGNSYQWSFLQLNSNQSSSLPSVSSLLNQTKQQQSDNDYVEMQQLRDGTYVGVTSASSSSSSASPSSASSSSPNFIKPNRKQPSTPEHLRKPTKSIGSSVGSSNSGSSSSASSASASSSSLNSINNNGNIRNGGHDHGRYWRDMDSLHYTESEPYGIKAVHPRTHWIDDQRHHDRHVVVDPKKTTCMLYLQADHLFFEKMGSEEACIESMTRHVQKVNNIYKNTDFDQDGRPDNISFLIKRIKVHTLEALKESEYRYPSTYGVEKFLELFSEEDYDAFCLAYMFTYRDFEGGTLGLAWTGDLKNAGGVCEKNGHYRGSLKSLNTGIVTLLNYGKHVPPIVSHVTLAHEIGHNFGSPHDPEDDHACTPGGENGNYIMFARATSGDKRNNNKFSPCSLRSINAVLNTKAKSLKGCFQEPQDAICGNEVVEEGEECDCGWEEDCKEPCCFPMRANPPADEPPCRLRPNVICSPSQGPCCTQDCKLKVGNKCRDDNGCRTASYCNGQGPQCPLSTNKANKTICNEEYVCYMGECTGSICMAYGLESCQCKQGPNDPPTKLCELCCRMPSDDSTCKSSFEWNTTPYDVPDLYAKPGTPCDNYNGYCDVNQRCREVDPSSPLATLRRLLLSNESMASLKRWFNEQWFYVAVLILITVLILLMAYKVFNSRRSLKLTKTDIMEVALEAVAKHQQEQQQQQQQQQTQQQQSQQQIQSSTQSTASDSQSQASNSKSTVQSSLSGTSGSISAGSGSSAASVANNNNNSTSSSGNTTSSSSAGKSPGASTSTTTAIINTPPSSQASLHHSSASSVNGTHNVPLSALQSKNSIDSQASSYQDATQHSSSAANSYQLCSGKSNSGVSNNNGGGASSASAATNNSIDSSYAGALASAITYIPSQQSSAPNYQLSSKRSMTESAIKASNAAYAAAAAESLYGTMKSVGHSQQQSSLAYYQPKQTASSAAHQASILSLQDTLYHHPFSASSSGNAANCIYGYTGQRHSQGTGIQHHSQGPVAQHQSHQHHHSIPSLYQPSMIYQQPPSAATAAAMQAAQSYYDPANSALAIVGGNQHHNNAANQAASHQHYGTYGAQLSAEPTYGQFYYPAPSGRHQHHQPLNYHPASSYYQSSSLYDYIPFPRPVNPSNSSQSQSSSNTTSSKVPSALPTTTPVANSAQNLSQQQSHHSSSQQHQQTPPPPAQPQSLSTLNSTSKSRSSATANLDSQRLYSSSLEVPGHKSTSSYYNTKNSATSQAVPSGKSTGSGNGHHHHHYYYHQVYGTTGTKFAHHYGTVHRSSALSASIHQQHNHPIQPGTGTLSSSQRHYQHYYPNQQALGHSSTSTTPQPIQTQHNHHQHHSNRQHLHSSHPQLLHSTAMTVSGGTSSSSGLGTTEPLLGHSSSNTGTAYQSRQRHSDIYGQQTVPHGQLSSLPSSVGHYGFSLEHSNLMGHHHNSHNNNSIYYSTRSEVFANEPSLAALASAATNLHHSSSFNGHLDDFDQLLDSHGSGSASITANSSASATVSGNDFETSSNHDLQSQSQAALQSSSSNSNNNNNNSGSGKSHQSKNHGASGWV